MGHRFVLTHPIPTHTHTRTPTLLPRSPRVRRVLHAVRPPPPLHHALSAEWAAAASAEWARGGERMEAAVAEGWEEEEEVVVISLCMRSCRSGCWASRRFDRQQRVLQCGAGQSSQSAVRRKHVLRCSPMPVPSSVPFLLKLFVFVIVLPVSSTPSPLMSHRLMQ
jgi:hypothetical protein